MNNELRTGADGHLQVTFRDNTVLTLSEDARVVIDRYVYEPGQGMGDVLLTTTLKPWGKPLGKPSYPQHTRFKANASYNPLKTRGADAGSRTRIGFPPVLSLSATAFAAHRLRPAKAQSRTASGGGMTTCEGYAGGVGRG